MRKRKFFRNLLKKMVIAVVIFIMAAGGVCEAKAAVTFPDVTDPSSYYYDAVYWAVGKDITTGRGGYFKPNNLCTRGEAVTFLYRLAGSPGVTGSSSFADITDSKAWYYNAVIWAAQNEITTGYGAVNGKPVFRPDVTCNRAMIVTLIMRYAQKIGKNYRKPSGTGLPFPDLVEGAWYVDAVRWAAARGITTGKGDGKFYPNEQCTRAQIVTFLYRYVYMKGEDIELPAIPI